MATEEIINKPNDDAYFSINYYMSGKLGLKGAELMLYGLINGFCQDGNSFCYSSMSYIEDLTGLSHTAVARAMENLIQKNLVVTEQVQSYQKQTESGKIITVKAKGSQFFALRYTVKSRPKIQKIIDDLSFYSEKLKNTKNKDLSKIKTLIKEIKLKEAKNKARNCKEEVAEKLIKESENICLKTSEDVSKALLTVHYNSINSNLIHDLLSELSLICGEKIENKSEPESTSTKKILVNSTDKIDEYQNGTGTSTKMGLDNEVYEYQKDTRTSTNLGHHNNTENNLDTKLTTTTMNRINSENEKQVKNNYSVQNKNSAVAVVSDFENILIKLFGYNPAFPANTYQTLQTLFGKNNLDMSLLEDYMSQMYKTLEKSCKDKSKFSIYYLKTFLYEQYIAKFAYDIHIAEEKKLEAEKNMIICPVCGHKHNKKDFECPECKFLGEHFEDSYKVQKAVAERKLQAENPEKYLEYEEEIKKIIDLYSFCKIIQMGGSNSLKTKYQERDQKLHEIENKYLEIKTA